MVNSKIRLTIFFMGFPGGSEDKVSTCNAGDPGSIPGLGRSPGEGNGNPLQYSCLENPINRGAWWATVHGVTKSRIWLSNFTFFLSFFFFRLVTQWCLILFYPMDCSPPGSSVDGIPQAKMLEWVAILFSSRSSKPRDQLISLALQANFFTIWATREAPTYWLPLFNDFV